MVTRQGPVARGRVAIGGLLMLAFLVGMIAVVEALRHPLPEGFEPDIGLADDDSDPRLPIDCGQALPREGQERGDATDPESTAQVVGREVSSSQLYDCPETYDGATVRYTGEVIGAVLDRSGGAWVQLNDDIYGGVRGPLPAHRDYRGGNAGIGVFIPSDLAAQIEWIGGPSSRGDQLRITGTFERVDDASAEVAVIRATSGSVHERGSVFERQNLGNRRTLAIIVAMIAIGATVAERVVARRR